MQNNFITFRPEIKDVKIKRVELICDTHHVYGIRTDISQNCCDRKMKSFTQIGREENTSISTVMRIFHDIEVPHKELDYEAVYLDEFRLTNSSD